MVIKYTEQTEIRESARLKSGCQTNTNRLKYAYCFDRTHRRMGFAQTEIRLLTTPNRVKYRYEPDQNLATNQTEHTKKWV